MSADLAVIARDPLFGGGGREQVECFSAGASALGYSTEVVFDRHPGLRGPRLTWRRVEAVRALSAAGRVELPQSRATWLVSTHAYDGLPAVRRGVPFSAWIGTTVRDEWRARQLGLGSTAYRVAAGLSVPALAALERRVLRTAVRLFATSPASRRAIADAAERDDVEILPIAVDVEHFLPRDEREWQKTLERPQLAFVGRADDPRKNVGALLEAARLLPEVDVVLVGAPPRRAVPPNTRVLGPVADVADALRDATMFVLPSFQEGFGIVVAEAMACGLPVISTPCGGPEEMIHAAGAGTVTSGFGGEEIAAAVQALLENPTALEAMRTGGRSYVERVHSPAAFATALAEALEA